MDPQPIKREFKVINNLKIPKHKTNNEYCWCFVPYLKIKGNEDNMSIQQEFN
jgi:hypothetical protein